MEKFGSLGPLIIGGDFNAKCEDLDMDSEGFLRGTNMAIVKGGKEGMPPPVYLVGTALWYRLLHGRV